MRVITGNYLSQLCKIHNHGNGGLDSLDYILPFRYMKSWHITGKYLVMKELLDATENY